MTEKIIDLSLIESVKSFVQEVRYLDGNVDIVRGNYVVDGASILGILSFDLSKPITAVLHSDNPESINKFNEICKRYE